MAALIGLIVLGFAMMTLGVALLFLGEVPFVAGRRISAWRSRLIGAILAMFLPLAWLLNKAVQALVPETVEPQAVTWGLFGVCWCLVLVILFRVMVPKRQKKPAAKGAPSAALPAQSEPAAESLAWMDAAPEPEPAPKSPAQKKPPAKKPARRAAEPDNPFDFS